MKPASRKPIAISFQSIASRRGSWRRRRARRRPSVSRRAPAQGLLAAARGARGRSPAPPGRGAGLLLQPRRDEAAQQQRHQRDHDDAADELGERELPADQHPEDEAELPDQVGRGELEGERGDRRGALCEERAGDRDRRVGAGGGGGAEPGRLRDRAEAVPGEAAFDPLARHPGLDDAGDREADHQRPPDLVGHQEGLFEPLADLLEDARPQRPTKRPSAATSSSTFSARSPPSASITQWRCVVDQPERDLVERRLDRPDLGEHVDAVPLLLDHPRDPATCPSIRARRLSSVLVSSPVMPTVPRGIVAVPSGGTASEAEAGGALGRLGDDLVALRLLAAAHQHRPPTTMVSTRRSAA